MSEWPLWKLCNTELPRWPVIPIGYFLLLLRKVGIVTVAGVLDGSHLDRAPASRP